MKSIVVNLRLFKNSIVNSMKRMGVESASVVSSDSEVFKPPERVRGMKVLDRDAFAKRVKLHALLVPNASLQKFLKIFKNERMPPRRAETQPVSDIGKYITMSPEFRLNALNQVKLEELKKLNIEQTLHEVTLDVRYSNYKHHEILGAVMPVGITANSGFERVGHIIHVNLLDEQKPFKNIIGQVLLDTHKTARTVVDKACTIDNTYRNFEMDVIAGEADFNATVVEHGRKFEFDFSKVFWNSRLETEHRRIYDLVSKDDIVFDVFAGVGPFSVPLAKKGCEVFANDLNEESYKWLCHNAKLNKTQLQAFNLDGREFIKSKLSNLIRSRKNCRRISIIMNLPGHAIDFLDAFRDILSSESTEEEGRELLAKDIPTISVYCYTFSSAEDKIFDVRTRAEERLGQALPECHEIRDVRKVSPKKDQFCLSFDLPLTVIMHTNPTSHVEDLQPASKRLRLSV